VKSPCTVPGCERFVIAKGYCDKHYRRWRIYGDPNVCKPNVNGLEDFWEKVKKSEGCWTWLAAKDEDGYGFFWWKNRQVRAHRFMMETIKGHDITGKDVLHSCDNPSCVRPSHLFLGDAQSNADDREAKGRGVKGRKRSLQHTANVVASRLRGGKKWTQEMKDRMSRIRRGLEPVKEK
jgi:hypothetical protein